MKNIRVKQRQINRFLICAMLLTVIAITMVWAPVLSVRAEGDDGTEAASGQTASEPDSSEPDTSEPNTSDPVQVIDIPHNGTSIYLADGERYEENTDIICDWGGVSSIFVWVSLMKLKEEGLIELDVPVKNYLPEDFAAKSGLSLEFTLLDLMNHTAGFQQNQAGHVLLAGEKFTSLGEWLIQNKTSQVYEAGDYVAYSDYGVTLAAYVIENVTGVAYYDYVRTNILYPLGMDQTAIYYDHSDCDYIEDNTTSETYRFGFYPANSARGTIADMEKFIQALIADDDTLLKRETKNEFLEATLNYRDASGMGKPRIAHGLAVYPGFDETVYGMNFSDLNATRGVYFSGNRDDYVIFCNENAPAMYEFNRFELSKAFGGKTMKLSGYHDRLSDMAGSYIKADATVKGIYSFSSLLNVYTLKAKSEKELALSTRPWEAYMTQINNGMFECVDGEVGHFYYVNYKERVLEFPFFDMIVYPKWFQLAKIGLLLLYFAGFIYSNLTLAISFIAFLVRLAKKSEAKSPRFRKYHYIQCGVYAFHGIIFQIMALTYLMGINSGIASASKIMFYLGAIMTAVYWMFFLRSGIKEECGMFEKVLYWVSAVCGVLQVAFSIVFGLILSK